MSKAIPIKPIMGIAALNPSYGLDSSPMPIHSPWRADFPRILALDGEGQTYLDSAATAQKPQTMLDAQDQALELPR